MIRSSVMLSVLTAYVVIMVGFSFFVWRKNRNRKQSLTRAAVPWYVLLATYIASVTSVWLFFAAPGAYYRGGIGYWMSELCYIPLFPVVAHFTTNKVWIINKQAGGTYSTPSDFFDERYKSPALRIAISLVMLCAAVPYIMECIAAIAQALEYATGGNTSYEAACIIVGVVTTVFIFLGGVNASAWADTIQGLVYNLILLTIVIAAVTIGFGGTLTRVVKQLWVTEPTFFSYPGPDGWMPYSVRIGYPLSCLFGWSIMLPHVFVRIGYFGDQISANRRMNTFAPWVQAFAWTSVCIVGMTMLAVDPNLTSAQSEMIIPIFIQDYIRLSHPAFATFLMVAFFVACTAVSLPTSNAFLSISAAILTEDILKKTLKVKIDARNENTVNRIFILLLGIASTWMALNPPQLMYTMMTFSTSIVMPLFVVLVFGIYWKRATKQAAVVSTVAGCGLVLCTYFVWKIGDLWYGTIGMVAALVLMILVSLLTKQDPQDSARFYELLESGMKKYYTVKRPYIGEKSNKPK